MFTNVTIGSDYCCFRILHAHLTYYHIDKNSLNKLYKTQAYPTLKELHNI